MAKVKEDAIRQAYEDVRSDSTDTTWLVCKYDTDGTIDVDCCGESYEELLQQLGDEDRAFAFVRLILGDELSKRAKFAFITWTGPQVNGLKRAKISPDKTQVKRIITSFAAEITADNKGEVELNVVRELLLKAGGANYGTGQRD